MKVGKQVAGHRKPYPREKRRALFSRFGMARRVLVSTALISDAELIIADGPPRA